MLPLSMSISTLSDGLLKMDLFVLSIVLLLKWLLMLLPRPYHYYATREFFVEI